MGTESAMELVKRGRGRGRKGLNGEKEESFTNLRSGGGENCSGKLKVPSSNNRREA